MHDELIGKRDVGGLTLITLGGELDLAAVPALRRGLDSSPTAALPDLALDMRQVQFMDCAAVSVLIAVYKQVRAAGGCLRLFGAQPEPAHLLQLSSLDRLLCLHVSAGDATASVCSRHQARFA
ncbi:MAG: anti-sigma factor antagonist [Nocardioidaceae bacterium]|nr:anti-sigma factor antagonist [Nocardioidaceae bacterium]